MQRYLQVGGANIDELNERIKDWQKTLGSREALARQYQQLTRNLGLPSDLIQPQLEANQHEAAALCEQIAVDIKLKQEEAYQKVRLAITLPKSFGNGKMNAPRSRVVRILTFPHIIRRFVASWQKR